MLTQNQSEQIRIGTIFFGGGTPSILSVTQLEKILTTAETCFLLEPQVEITLEANPGTVTREYLKEIRALGINRVSFGMQSARPEELRLLHRLHTHEDVINAVKWSKQAGFERINLDLIFGIPEQTSESWAQTLEFALKENVDHFSLYSLILEEGAPLEKWAKRGLINIPDDDTSASMYEFAMDRLKEAGFTQYEISNWARQGKGDQHCQHNLQYWRYLPYLGLGAGAHGFVDGTRTENVGGIAEYIQRMKDGQPVGFPGSPACKELLKLSLWDQMQEFLMVGFRLTDEGVSRSDFQKRFGRSLDALFQPQIARLIRLGLIEAFGSDRDRLRLSRRGRLLGNQVFGQFVGNIEPVDLKTE